MFCFCNRGTDKTVLYELEDEFNLRKQSKLKKEKIQI